MLRVTTFLPSIALMPQLAIKAYIDTVGALISSLPMNFCCDLPSAQPLAFIIPVCFFFKNIKYNIAFSVLNYASGLIFLPSLLHPCQVDFHLIPVLWIPIPGPKLLNSSAKSILWCSLVSMQFCHICFIKALYGQHNEIVDKWLLISVLLRQ